MAGSDGDAADVDRGVLALEVPADELEGLEHRDAAFHPGERLPGELLDLGSIADGTDHGSGLAPGDVGVGSDGAETLDDMLDVAF